MARADDTELIDTFEEFYRSYYRNEIGELAQKYPNEQKSLYIDWQDLYRFDPHLADDFRNKPEQLREYAEEALRLYDLPVDVSLGQAHVRVRGLPEQTDIREIRSDHRGMLIAIQGIVRKATDVRPKITTAAFECQRCGTLTRIPQEGGDFQEPHECQGCERQGPFRINYDQSEFIDAQKLRVQESPEGLRGGETPQSVDVNIEDDITGEVTAGDHVQVTGTLQLDQQGSEREKSPMFDFYMNGMSVEIEDEQFEEMDITDEDKKEIIELSNEPDIYKKMEESIAPSIYGYEKEKRAMIFQLFSGVTKHLPDGSRTRGDLHMLLIGDPGTGKCVKGDTRVTLEDGTRPEIRDIVEANLTEPEPIDDGVYDTVDIPLPTMTPDGKLTEGKATKVWKRSAPDKMYRIRTSRGKELEVTPSHPLYTLEGCNLTSEPADSLKEGQFIAAPESIPVDGDESLNVDYRESKANNAVRLELPSQWTPWLSRLVGYIIAEGYVRKREDHTGYVSVTNGDEEILADIERAYERLGLPCRRRSREEKTAKEIRCSSGEFVSFLEQLEPRILEPSAQQRVPNAVMTATWPIKSTFLQAYIDSECHVSRTQRELTVASMSERLLQDVHSLLREQGIHGTLSERNNGSYRLRITGVDFERYVSTIGFITARKSTASSAFEGVSTNTNTDIVPNVGETLRTIRETLALSQADCGLPRTTYQHYERGDRNPSRASLSTVVSTFEERLSWLENKHDTISQLNWEPVEDTRTELNVSQQTLADGLDITQTAVSYHERNATVTDGGTIDGAEGVLSERIEEALGVAPLVDQLRNLVEADIRWERIESIETVEPDYEWVYDLEVRGTHNYVSDGVMSHNSAMLQYVKNIAPRSVYTSGKGSSSAGLTAAAVRDDFGDGQQWTLEAGALVLADQGIAAVDELDKMRCVTGDTLVSTSEGKIPIEKIAQEAEVSGEIEELERGRTIRGVDLEAWTMTENNSIERRPVTAVHEYTAPQSLREITLESGESVTATSDHPFFVLQDGERTEKPAENLENGDWIYVPRSIPPSSTDGGMTTVDDSGATPSEVPNTTGDVTWRQVEEIKERSPATDGYPRVYDLTVEDTHNFVANDIIIHNSEDQSAMHEALEQQSISVSKAGINATLKSRCSLLGAANPTYGRFDQYEPIGEQIDLDPPLISRFDLIFTVTDNPNEEKDAELAEHILKTNYAGELNTHREHMSNSDYTEEEVENVTDDVAPNIDAELLRKYIAYAKRNCYPTMTEEAKGKIQEFYVQLRAHGSDEDAPVPVTARKLEALVRLSEASARVRLSDTVEQEDAERATAIARYCLEDIGMDPETGEFDADVIETGTSKSQRDRIKNIKHLISTIEDEYDEGAPVDVIIEQAEEEGIETAKAEHEIEKLKQKGEVYEPRTDHLRTT